MGPPPDLKRWIDGHADEEVKLYKDTFTGKTMHRKGWNRLQHAIVKGLVSNVVWRLDRWGRTASGLTKRFDELREKKVGLISLKDRLDLSTAAGRLMENVLASVAQDETEVRADRVLAGQAKGRAEGKTWGGSEKERRLKVTKELIKSMARAGETKAGIAWATGLSRLTVYNHP